MATIDSYSETNQDTFRQQYATESRGQSFDPGATSYSVTSCKFYLKKQIAPTGTVTANIYAHSGTYGTSSVSTGAALATSVAFDVSTLTTSFQLIEFTFSTPYIISASTYYIIALNSNITGDASNTVDWGDDSSSPSAGGNACFGAAATGPTSADNTRDFIFYVYGTEYTPTATGNFFQLF